MNMLSYINTVVYIRQDFATAFTHIDWLHVKYLLSGSLAASILAAQMMMYRNHNYGSCIFLL